MKILKAILLVFIACHFGITRITTIQNIRHIKTQAKITPERRLESHNLKADLNISESKNDLFANYMRYTFQLQKDEHDSDKLTKLVHKLLNSIDDFSLLLNDHISDISNQINTQKLDYFIKSSPYGSGLD